MTTMPIGVSVWVGSSNLSDYRGELILTTCDCCPQHTFWRTPESSHICYDCNPPNFREGARE